jgi:hypothetical protein
VFLAPDYTRLQDLDEAVRRFLAWKSILNDKDSLNLSAHQVRQAQAQMDSVDGAVMARIPETYQWLIVPQQSSPQGDVEWQSIRLSGQEALAVRVSRRLRNDELLLNTFAGTLLRMELDRVPLWRGDNVSVNQIVDDFGRYLYLPRLKEPAVLLESIQGGLAFLTWAQDSFAYADSYDENAGRYRGLRSGELIPVSDSTSSALLVRPEVAMRQIEAERPPVPGPVGEERPPADDPVHGSADVGNPGPENPPVVSPKRFHGTVTLDSTRVGRDAGQIAEEVIAHLAGLSGGKVKVTLEIEADMPDGVPEQVVRIVTENSRTLKFDTQGFEEE